MLVCFFHENVMFSPITVMNSWTQEWRTMRIFFACHSLRKICILKSNRCKQPHMFSRIVCRWSKRRRCAILPFVFRLWLRGIFMAPRTIETHARRPKRRHHFYRMHSSIRWNDQMQMLMMMMSLWGSVSLEAEIEVHVSFSQDGKYHAQPNKHHHHAKHPLHE